MWEAEKEIPKAKTEPILSKVKLIFSTLTGLKQRFFRSATAPREFPQRGRSVRNSTHKWKNYACTSAAKLQQNFLQTDLIFTLRFFFLNSHFTLRLNSCAFSNSDLTLQDIFSNIQSLYTREKLVWKFQPFHTRKIILKYSISTNWGKACLN